MSPVHQHRYNWNFPSKRRGNLDTHKIIRPLKATTPEFVLSINPSRTNDSKKDFAAAYLLFQHFHEINARRNCVDIHEDIVSTYERSNFIVEPSSGVGLVLATVADENLRH